MLHRLYLFYGAAKSSISIVLMLLGATPRVVWERHFIIPARKCWSQEFFDCRASLCGCQAVDPIRIARGAKCSKYPRESQCEKSGNTTHGSGWIVQVRPTQGRTWDSRFSYLLLPRAARGDGNKTRGAPGSLRRLDLNNPRTAVGGISGVFHTVSGLTLPLPDGNLDQAFRDQESRASFAKNEYQRTHCRTHRRHR